MTIINSNIRPKGITVQVRDDIKKTSKSFTVHGISFNKLFYHLLNYTNKLTKFVKIKLVCYKEELNDEKKIERTGTETESEISDEFKKTN